MEPTALVACIRESLGSIAAPRFFETERGFQGELLAQLARRVQLAEPAIVEQEYQKQQQKHGLTIRPDIIIHEPFDPQRHADRTRGNLAVVELKLNATEAEATQDFQNLAAMLRVLRYPIGIFVNIGTTLTYGDLVPHEARGRIVSFAVSLVEGSAHVIEERT